MNRTFLLFTGLMLLVFSAIQAQVPGSGYQVKEYKLPEPKPFGDGITAEELKFLVDTLASDAMQGRETGEEGQRMAADFIAMQFKEAGLEAKADRNTYFQKITLQRNGWDNLALKIGATEYVSRKDYYVLHKDNITMPVQKIKEVVFVGYGIEDKDWNDYSGADVAGKVVMFYAGEPIDETGNSVLTGSVRRTKWTMDTRYKLELAKQKGAVLALVIDPQFAENTRALRREISTYGWRTVGVNPGGETSTRVNAFFVTPELGETIMGKKADKLKGALKAGQSKPAKLKTSLEFAMEKSVKYIEGSNVIGVVEGTDPKLKDEYVMVTAHYDHLGIADSMIIYNGADDNASGTAGVIEIARAFAAAKAAGEGPARTVVFMLVSGEEKGLLGSRFYVDFPVFSLKKTIANINIDMIGRVDKAHEADSNYVYVIGSDRISTELHRINEKANETYTQLNLDYKFNDPNDPNRFYERSDHYNFAKNNIPVIFFFSGVHEDYHKPTDTRDKILFPLQAKRAQLAFYTIWELANRPGKLPLDKL